VFHDITSQVQELIPEVILGEKCYIIMIIILSGLQRYKYRKLRCF
jgi:hypothetical protein